MVVSISGTALAETCPAPPDMSSELAPLMMQLKSAKDASKAKGISSQLWALCVNGGAILFHGSGVIVVSRAA